MKEYRQVSIGFILYALFSSALYAQTYYQTVDKESYEMILGKEILEVNDSIMKTLSINKTKDGLFTSKINFFDKNTGSKIKEKEIIDTTKLKQFKDRNVYIRSYEKIDDSTLVFALNSSEVAHPLRYYHSKSPIQLLFYNTKKDETFKISTIEGLKFDSEDFIGIDIKAIQQIAGQTYLLVTLNWTISIHFEHVSRSSQVYLLKLNNEFEAEWLKRYSPISNSKGTVYSYGLSATEANEILLATEVVDLKDANRLKKVRLFRLDLNGNILQEKVLNNHEIISDIHFFEEVEKGKFLIAGLKAKLKNPFEKYNYISLLDNDFSPIWSIEVPTHNFLQVLDYFGEFNGIKGVQRLNNQEFIAFSNVHHLKENDEIYKFNTLFGIKLFKFNLDGDLLWERLHYKHPPLINFMPRPYEDLRSGYVHNSFETSFLFHEDFLYFYSSTVQNPEVQPQTLINDVEWIVRTDLDGCVGDSCDFKQVTSTLSTSNFSCRVYPNPFTNYVKIETNDILSKTDNLKILIKDLNGRNIQPNSVLLLSDVIEIDLSKVPSGLYFLTIYNPDLNQSTTEKILKL